MIRKHQLGTKLIKWIDNSFDKPKKFYNKINSSPVNINNLVKYKDEYDNTFMDQKLLKAVDNYMIKKNVGLPQRQAILYTIWQEGSKTGPHGNGASGLVGWRGLRAKGLPNTIEGQAEKLYNEAFGSFNSNNWNHGGEGSGYKSGKEAQQAFLNAKTYSDAVRALNYGYVRPPLASIQKRTSTKNMFKKGGKLQKLQYGSPIYYDQNKGYVTNNIPLTLDKNGNLYANGQKGTVMLPEVTINGKGNITQKTLLKRWLPQDYTKKDIYDLFDFLGHIPINNNVSNSKPLSDDEINWYNNYMQDKVRKFELFNKSPKDPISYAVELNPINQRPASGASENYILDIITRAHNQALQDQNNYYNSEEYKQRLDKMDPSLRKVIKPMNNNIPFKIMSDNNFEENVIAEANGGTKQYVSYNLGNVDSSPYSTSTHELSHIHDYYYPILNNYNNKYIKLNPYLSDKDKSYYGKPTEIKARAMEVFMDYLNNKNKYNSIEDFINKNQEHRTLNQLKYIFKDEKSLLDYLNNFVQNDITPIDKFKNYYAKQGGKLL